MADPAAAASRAAAEVAAVLRAAVEARGVAHVALSGGSTPWAMLDALRGLDLAWPAVHVWQVDERVAPDGDPARNLVHLEQLVDGAATLHPMAVGDRTPEAAASAYAAELPDRFDLVHLGLGPDGHTASLVPGDPVLDVADTPVAPTQDYQGHRRVTLTYPGLGRARRVLWLVVGAAKASALARLRAGDLGIPAGRVSRHGALVVADAAALSTAGPGATGPVGGW
ncbi:MAG: 6-phosphogluconolactonase [Acidimicrobiia bacterium]|nr:6-phosphogluconolactonase [Acidimicrobiia bacterium]